MKDISPLQGKLSLITGGGTETTQALALALSEQGASICLAGQPPEALEQVAAQIRTQGGECLAIPTDVTQEEQVQRLVAAALQAYGRIDSLVLVSAVWGGGPIHAHKLRTWDLVMAANLRANFLLSRAVLPQMRLQGHGHIVIVASDSALDYYEGEGAYGISMHALADLGEYIRRENQASGIQVTCLCPGLALTPQAGQDSITPQDIAGAVVRALSARPGLASNRPISIQFQP